MLEIIETVNPYGPRDYFIEYKNYSENKAIAFFLNISIHKFIALVRRNNGVIHKRIYQSRQNNKVASRETYHFFRSREDCERLRDELEALMILNRIVGE